MPNINDVTRRRSTVDLIDELDAEGNRALFAAIAVGFPTRATFVFAADVKRLAALNRLVKKAGRPVGIVALHQDRRGIQFSCRPFQEYGDSEWAWRYLLDFSEVVLALYRGRRHPAMLCPINN